MQNNPNGPPGLVTISVNLSPLRRLVHNPFLWLLLFFTAFGYFIYRDTKDSSRQDGQSTPPTLSANQGPFLLNMTMFTGQDTSGTTFTLPESKSVHVTIRDSTGSHIVINRYNGPVVWTIKGSNYDGEKQLEPGQYVLSLIARGGRTAKAFVEVR